MKSILLCSIIMSLSIFSIMAQADEIEYTCVGAYNSNRPADTLEPSSISVKVHLEATMLGDENAKGEGASFFLVEIQT